MAKRGYRTVAYFKGSYQDAVYTKKWFARIGYNTSVLRKLADGQYSVSAYKRRK